MRNYKKTLLTLMVVSAMPLLAATNSATAPIKVTTFNDENKEMIFFGREKNNRQAVNQYCLLIIVRLGRL